MGNSLTIPGGTTLSTASKQIVFRKLVLVTTYVCNMRCIYCYYGDKNLNILSNKVESKKTVMDCTTVREVFTLLRDIGALHEDSLVVQIFGGEPSLFPDLIKCAYEEIPKILRNSDVIFSISTNGFHFSEKFLNILNKSKGFQVTVSIDGPREIHDLQRRSATGKGTFDKVLKNIRELARLRYSGKLRKLIAEVTVTKYTLERGSLYSIAEFLRDLGFDDVVMHIVEGVPWLKPDVSKLMSNRIELLQKNFERLLSGESPLDSSVVSLIRSIISPGIRQCGAGRDLIAVTPEGDLYPCQGFVGIKDFLIGNIADIRDYDDLVNRVNNVVGLFGTKMMDPRCNKCPLVEECPKICLVSNVLNGRKPWQFSDEYCSVLGEEIVLTKNFLERLGNDRVALDIVIKSLKRWSSDDSRAL